MSPPKTARQAALSLLDQVLDRRALLDDVLDAALDGLEPRERRFARAITMAALRHKGSIERLIARFLSRPLPRSGRRAHLVLLSGAAQLLFVGSPAHAVVNEQVDLLPAGSKFRGVVNAVLRRIDRDGRRLIAMPEIKRSDTPAWLWRRWVSAYGEATARRIVEVQQRDAPVPLDLTVPGDAAGWADRLGGTLMPTGSVRLEAPGSVTELAGYGDGAWWVQDAAAALPVRLFGDLAGRSLLDTCAAPGGKTAQAAAAGATVTALDRSSRRLETLKANMRRLGLEVETIEGELGDFAPGRAFDAVLLDAPCTATGTLRRHPDIAWTRGEADVAEMALQQRILLGHAARHLRPGGMLVYCTCSLEPEEGERQADRFLADHRDFARRPLDPVGLGLPREAQSAAGDLRTLPSMLAESGGMDGFFAARFVKA